MRPYVIFSYDYDETSNGSIIFHKLCHYLNERGCRAYMSPKTKTNLKLNTPIFDNREKPEEVIAIYTDVVPGNASGATRVVRWITNTFKFYREIMKWPLYRVPDNGELLFTYDRSFHPTAPILTINEIDKTIFYPPKTENRNSSAYYLGKARFLKQELPLYIRQGIRLGTGEGERIFTHQELAEIFRKVKVFYTYVGTQLSEMAIMCGCPVVFMGELQKEVADWNGLAKGENDIEKAITTIPKRIQTIEKQKDLTNKQVDDFIRITQEERNIPKTVVLDFDDFSVQNNNFYFLDKLKAVYPQLKVSMFYVVGDDQAFSSEHREIVLNKIRACSDWIELIPHGYKHTQGEFLSVNKDQMRAMMFAIDRGFKAQNLPYVKGFKAPHWLYSQAVVDYLDEEGWWLAVDRNQPYTARTKKFYEYNHSIDERFWLYTDDYVWKLHGHITPPSTNNIIDNMVNLSHIPEDYKFDFASNHLTDL